MTDDTEAEHIPGGVVEGRVSWWGNWLRAQRLSDGTTRFSYAGRWVVADSLTAMTFESE
jgi:hypothetical protein